MAAPRGCHLPPFNMPNGSFLQLPFATFQNAKWQLPAAAICLLSTCQMAAPCACHLPPFNMPNGSFLQLPFATFQHAKWQLPAPAICHLSTCQMAASSNCHLPAFNMPNGSSLQLPFATFQHAKWQLLFASKKGTPFRGSTGRERVRQYFQLLTSAPGGAERNQ
jgi:hypothetical protein